MAPIRGFKSTDVATVDALVEQAEALLVAIKKAKPAINRLGKAKYPGAEWVSAQATDTTDDQTSGSLVEVVGALEMFRKAAGDLGAAEYGFYVEYLNLDLGDAAKEIIDRGGNDVENLQSVEAMRQYAVAPAR